MNNNSPFASEIIFKVLTIGETEVGKTSVLLRLTENKFIDRCTPTIGVDFKTKCSIVNNNPIRINVWDTAGHEKYKQLTRQYYRGANGILLIYDVNCVESFDTIPIWIKEIESEVDIEQISIILIGNKIDLNHRVISTHQGLELANRLNLKFLEVSAKDNTNINILFDLLVHDMIFKNNITRAQIHSNRISINRKSFLSPQSNSFCEYC